MKSHINKWNRITSTLLALSVLAGTLVLQGCGGGGGANTNTQGQQSSTNNTVPAGILSTNTYGEIYQPEIYSYNNGEIMIWNESDGIKSSLMYQYKEFGQSSWSTPQLVPNAMGVSRKISSNGSEVMLVEFVNPGTVNLDLQYMIFTNSAWSNKESVPALSPLKWGLTVALDSNDNNFVIAVETTDASNQYNISLLFYINGKWSTSYPMQNNEQRRYIKLFYNAAGVLVTWSSNANRDAVVANYFDGQTWGTPKEFMTKNTFSFQVAKSQTNFAVAWQQIDSIDQNFSNVFVDMVDLSVSPVAWSASQKMNGNVLNNNAVQYSLASDGTGFSFVWNEIMAFPPAQNWDAVVSARIYKGSWSAPVALSTSKTIAYPVQYLKLVSNGTGYAASWKQSMTDSNNINEVNYYGAIYDGMNWLTTANLGTGSSIASFNVRRDLILTTDGKTYGVAWTDYVNNAASTVDFYAIVSQPDNTWPAGAELLKKDLDRLYNPLIVTSGGYQGLWFEDDGNGLVYFSKNYSSAGWDATSTEFLLPTKHGSAYRPQMAKNNKGDVVAVWIQYDRHDWYYYISTYQQNNSGVGWSKARKIQECGKYYRDISVDSNGADFMIYCQGIFPSAIGYQSSTVAIPVKNGVLGVATKLGKRGVFSTATDGAGYALVYKGPGLTAGMNGLFVQDYDVAAGQWTAGNMVYETTLSISNPVISSSGGSFAVSWYEQNASTQDIKVGVYNRSNSAWDITKVGSRNGTQLFDIVLGSYGAAGYIASWVDIDTYASFYSADTWSVPEKTEMSALRSYQTNGVVQGGDGLSLIWQTSNELYASIYASGQWQQESMLSNNITYSSLEASIAENSQKYAVVWNEPDQKIYYSSYLNGAWTPKITLSTGLTHYASKPAILSVADEFMVMWAQEDPQNATDKTALRIVLSNGI